MMKATSDPFVELIATSKDGRRVFRQQSSCKCKNVDPVYNETLEVPVATEGNRLEEVLGSVSPSLVKDTDRLSRCTPPEKWSLDEKRLSAAATKHRPPASFLSD